MRETTVPLRVLALVHSRDDATSVSSTIALKVAYLGGQGMDGRYRH